MARQRWFGGKSRRIVAVSVEDRVPLPGGDLVIVAVHLDDRTADRYAVPLGEGDGDEIVDGLDTPAFCRALLDLVADGGRAAGAAGTLVGQRTRAFPEGLPRALAVTRLGGEQSNTSVAFGEALILKHFRRLANGVNPELEMTRFLTERTAFRNTPRLAGALEYQSPSGSMATVAVVQEFVPDARDGWRWTLDQLTGLLGLARDAAPDDIALRARAATSLTALGRLGARTGELHRALASDPSDPAFAPEPIDRRDLLSWAAEIGRRIDAARSLVGGSGSEIPATDLLRPALASALAGLDGHDKIRLHGDYHLGQTLYSAATHDFVIIDFEGEPLRPLTERRAKQAALRDVAGLLRSIDYAAVTACRDGGGGAPAEAWSRAWSADAARAFLDAYRAAAGIARFVPQTDGAFAAASAAFELEKAAYEVVYEANNRPEWLPIPVRGLLRASREVLRRVAAGAA